MSSSRGAASDNHEKLPKLRAILGNEIPDARLIQVLEASNGSLEYAIEIYFHQTQNEPSQRSSMSSTSICDVPSPEPAMDNSDMISNVKNDTKKQGTNGPSTTIGKKRNQEKFTSLNSSDKKGGAKQARLDSFFGRNASKGLGSTAAIKNSKESKNEFDMEQRKEALPDTNLSKTPATLKSFPQNSSTSIPKTVSQIDTKPKSIAPRKDKQADIHPASFLSFQRLCEALQEMSDTTKRLGKLSSLETLIREIMHAEIPTDGVAVRAKALSSALELVLGGTTSKPLNVSGSAVSKALQTSFGVSRAQISKAYRKNGDIGDCAAQFFQKKTHFVIASHRRQLSVLQVMEGLYNISETDGRDAKQHILLTLLRTCQSKMECRFLVRLLIRNMRIGANIKTILAALAMAMVPKAGDEYDGKKGSKNADKNSSTSENSNIDTKDAITMVQKTYDICPSISKIVTALLEGGLHHMKRECSIQVLTPIAPMLAHPIHSLEEIHNKMGDQTNEAMMEWKYDGMRCQAHFDGSNFKLFSRHMLDMTDQFPDVAKFLQEAINKKEESISFVIDAEIVGVEGQGSDAQLLPFQDLSTRRKKMDDGNGTRVKVFAFDIMLLNGESLVNEELYERKDKLYELFNETDDFSFVSSQKLIAYDEGKIKTFLTEAIEHGAEGLMIKLLGRKPELDDRHNSATGEEQAEVMNSLYEAGTRSHSWLKVKRDYVAGFSDTVDVVPIGAWWGSGRKATKSFLSPILLAVYDDEEDVYRSICRCMTFTDAMYESVREFYFNGTAYPPSLNSEVAKTSTENPEQKDDASVDDGNSCDGENDGIDKGEESQIPSKIEGVEQERVNCFPNRPSSAFVITNESPPIWFKPMEVFEVAFADLSLSRQHTAAAGLVDEEGRGVALRFPRFKRRRPDKKPEQATTSIEIAKLFAKQAKIKNASRSFQTNRSKQF